MEPITLISVNRPLTRAARRALSEFNIIERRDINELGHWTEIDVEECPPNAILDRHELVLEDPTGGETPQAVYQSISGRRVEVYEDQVFEENREMNIDPDEAITHAEKVGWTELSA